MTIILHRLAGQWYVDGYVSDSHHDWCPVALVDGALYHIRADDLTDSEPDMAKPVEIDADGLTYPAATHSVAFAPRPGEIERITGLRTSL